MGYLQIVGGEYLTLTYVYYIYTCIDQKNTAYTVPSKVSHGNCFSR